MTKEELYKLSLDSYHEYPLLTELMAIRDERFKDEQQDNMLCVNGYVGLDTLNNYVKLQQENTNLRIEISAREEEYRKLEDNWNKLKESLRFIYDFDYGAISDCLDKMQKLERGVSDVED